ncbi:substrate-binding domain-containing protein [Subtercola endophyticus]|uniref:substrate-binding domain-containing protein n=1 Tax=Subtercola endophyticus TaxID=2895559 RepID=UPI001E4AA4C1|nr:substrate-binding domain-containing protein [Subtercola endophyticus]UFS58610.1 substrate-binding domain-containing protein [Subtercola endophyticus]
MRKRNLLIGAAALASAVLVLSGCAPSSSTSAGSTSVASSAEATAPTDSTEGYDITKLCGTDPIKVALLDGAGGHTWRNINLEEAKVEAAKCPNVTLSYADAGGDASKMNSNIQGFVAQGYNVILDIADFGTAELPALRAATKAGVTTIVYYNALEGTPGVDYTENVTLDSEGMGEAQGAWIAANAKPGNVVVLGGPATCSSCQALYDGVAKALAGNSKFTVLGDGKVTATDYDPTKAQQAVAGLLASSGNITAVAGDYGVIADDALKAFAAAGAPAPVLATANGQNSQYCDWATSNAAGTGYPFASWEGGLTVVKVALRAGLADYNKIDDPEPKVILLNKLIDTQAGVNPPACDTTLPDDADMFSGLTPAQIKEAVKG